MIETLNLVPPPLFFSLSIVAFVIVDAQHLHFQHCQDQTNKKIGKRGKERQVHITYNSIFFSFSFGKFFDGGGGILFFLFFCS